MREIASGALRNRVNAHYAVSSHFRLHYVTYTFIRGSKKFEMF